MADPIVDPYAVWTALLAGQKVEVHDGRPQCGYWELRGERGGKRRAVQIWRQQDTEELRADGGTGAEAIPLSPSVIWPRAYQRPISYETWLSVYEGRGWPDEAREAQPPANVAEKLAQPENASATLPFTGDNAPPPAGSLADFIDAADTIARIAAELLKAGITTQVEADRAANLKDRSVALKKAADAAYSAEVAPHNEAAAAVRWRWKPLQERLPVIADKLRAALLGFMGAEKKARETAAAEAVKGGADPTTVAVEPVRAGGAAGKRTSTRTYKSARITDYPVLLNALKDHPDVVAVVQTVANASARSGIPLAGMEITTETRVV